MIDRLARLRVMLPALAHEAAVARQEAARLRVQNKQLADRLAQHESPVAAVSCSPP